MRNIIKRSLIFFSLLIIVTLSVVLLLPSMLFADTTTFNAIPGTNWDLWPPSYDPINFSYDPINFSFDLTGISIDKVESANLRIWAYDVEDSDGSVAFNGTLVGPLKIGGYQSTSVSEFNVLNFLIGGINYVVATPGDAIKIYQSELIIETAAGKISAAAPLSPQDWVLKDLNIDELLAHYGPTPDGFVKIFYDTILGRVPDESGLNYWTEQLNTNIFTGSQIAEHFVFSDELGAKVDAMSSEEFITFLYNSFLSRTPDTDGFKSWVAYMESGVSKLDTLRAFMDNTEWFDICKMFNVAP